MNLKVWYNTSFTGHYPIGTAAIVCAVSAKRAAEILTKELAKDDLGPALEQDMVEFKIKNGNVKILGNGNY